MDKKKKITIKKIITAQVVNVVNMANEKQLLVDNYLSRSLVLNSNNLNEVVLSSKGFLKGMEQSLYNTYVKSMTDGINTSGRYGVSDIVGELVGNKKETLFKWVSINDGNNCSECAAENGKVKTWEEWQNYRTPEMGTTYCGDACRCYLQPVK